MKELELLYEGKSKQIYKTDSDNHVVIRFKDDTAAFYNIKRAIIEQKGRLTCDISAMVLDYLNRHNINTHFVERVGDDGQLCRVVEHIPVEVIVRNVEHYLAGLCDPAQSFCESCKLRYPPCDSLGLLPVPQRHRSFRSLHLNEPYIAACCLADSFNVRADIYINLIHSFPPSCAS